MMADMRLARMFVRSDRSMETPLCRKRSGV